jgi:CRISPR-associated endoribonuclease Cas6
MIYKKLTFKTKLHKPYEFIGSKVRGALGYALKEEVCVNPSYECTNCFAKDECIFYDFYEKQNITHSYRLDFKLEEEMYKFSILLFEDAQKYEDKITLSTLNSMKEIKQIKHKSKTKKIKLKNYSSIVKISFFTPLRIKRSNNFARDDIGIIEILNSISRRWSDLRKISHEREMFNEPKVVSKNLYYKELTRRSLKQNTKMNLGGIMGEMVLSGVDKRVYEILKIGEVIGVGKSTVFGLGKIKVEGLN